MSNSSIITFKGDSVRHIDPLKKADTAKQRSLIAADASCKTCKYFSCKTERCKAKAKNVKSYNTCKLHNLEILS